MDDISTRTPLAGSDKQQNKTINCYVQFQPALPLRGVTRSSIKSRAITLFQPALPLRGVTCSKSDDASGGEFQPALPLRGVTPTPSRYFWGLVFQPALPLRGVTSREPAVTTARLGFQPALPLRGVTGLLILEETVETISTRTPLAGSDAEFERVTAELEISTRTPLAGSDSR